jgi:hypothetical protein
VREGTKYGAGLTFSGFDSSAGMGKKTCRSGGMFIHRELGEFYCYPPQFQRPQRRPMGHALNSSSADFNAMARCASSW